MSDTTMTEQPAALKIEPPQPVADVTPDQAMKATADIKPEDKTKLDKQVDGAVDNLLSLEIHGDDFRSSIETVAKLGDADIRDVSSISNRLLDKPIRSMSTGGIAEGGKVSKDLLSLRRQVDKLNPSKSIGLLSGPKRILGFIPFGVGRKAVDYFRSYESAKGQIDAIVNSLYGGRDDLQRDIATIDEEKANMWKSMDRLKKFSYIAAQIDGNLEKKIAAIETTDPARAKVLKEEVLFRLRRKEQALSTQMAVTVQGYMTLDLVRRNDVALVEMVEEATSTTVAALRIGIMAAQALGDQKSVMDQVKGLNATTNNTILGTSEMLKSNSEGLAKMATDPSVDVETLRKAFDNIYSALDTADNYKIKALDAMKTTVNGLQAQITRADAYLDKERQAQIGTAAPKTPALTVD